MWQGERVQKKKKKSSEILIPGFNPSLSTLLVPPPTASFVMHNNFKFKKKHTFKFFFVEDERRHENRPTPWRPRLEQRGAPRYAVTGGVKG